MKRSPRLKSQLYRAVRALLLSQGVKLSTHDVAKLSRAAVATGFALQDANGRTYLITEENR